jgi:predicted transcriptional regulator
MTTLKPAFAPIPVRACADHRLRGLDFRILGILAAHERLGKWGCRKARKDLAAQVGCHISNVSHTIHRLMTWGYVRKERSPIDGRLWVYRVIYSMADQLILKKSALAGTESVTPQATEAKSRWSRRPLKREKSVVYPTHFGGPNDLQAIDFVENASPKDNLDIKKEIERKGAPSPSPRNSGASVAPEKEGLHGKDGRDAEGNLSSEEKAERVRRSDELIAKLKWTKLNSAPPGKPKKLWSKPCILSEEPSDIIIEVFGQQAA